MLSHYFLNYSRCIPGWAIARIIKSQSVALAQHFSTGSIFLTPLFWSEKLYDLLVWNCEKVWKFLKACPFTCSSLRASQTGLTSRRPATSLWNSAHRRRPTVCRDCDSPSLSRKKTELTIHTGGPEVPLSCHCTKQISDMLVCDYFKFHITLKIKGVAMLKTILKPNFPASNNMQ